MLPGAPRAQWGKPFAYGNPSFYLDSTATRKETSWLPCTRKRWRLQDLDEMWRAEPERACRERLVITILKARCSPPIITPQILIFVENKPFAIRAKACHQVAINLAVVYYKPWNIFCVGTLFLDLYFLNVLLATSQRTAGLI